MIGDTPAVVGHGWFVSGRAGPLYVFYQPPLSAVPPSRAVLVVPPFAEEMNKSRRMAALLARRLAAADVATLLLDLYGTGDSGGDFGDARWDIWRADVATAYDWLRARGCERISLLGIRLGALLALDVLRQAALAVERVVLWQPVVNGEVMLSQFLRIRVAAAMMAADKEKQTTQELQRALKAGQSIEVGGYELGPDLAGAIDPLRLEHLLDPRSPPIEWLEVVAADANALSPASRRVIDAWRTRGIDVRAHAVAGAPFWSSTEIATAPALLEATVRCLQAQAVST